MKTSEERGYEERSIVTEKLDYDNYDKTKHACRVIAVTYTIILVLVITVSQFLYSGMLGRVMPFLMGWKSLFPLYIFAIVVTADKTARFPLGRGRWNDMEKRMAERTYRRNRTNVFAIIFIGILFMIAGDKYVDEYSFKSCEVYVEEGSNMFHIIDCCSEITDKTKVKEMKCIDATDDGYEFCPTCEEFYNM